MLASVLKRSTRPIVANLTQRSIGNDLIKGRAPPRHIYPHEYDESKTPKLFTELKPAEEYHDESGNPVDHLEQQIDTIYNELMGQKEEGKKIRPVKQPEGRFKLDREIYKSILH